VTENVLTLLPPKARKAAYVVYGLLGLAGVGITAYYGAVPGLTVPPQVFGGLAVLGALSPAFSVLAASNVKPPQIETEADAARRANGDTLG
jgi:hypothetical protein